MSMQPFMDRTKDALKDAGLLPAFIETLPYRSEILELTNEEFGQMTAEQKSGLEQRLRAKLQQYREVNEQTSGRVGETQRAG